MLIQYVAHRPGEPDALSAFATDTCSELHSLSVFVMIHVPVALPAWQVTWVELVGVGWI